MHGAIIFMGSEKDRAIAEKITGFWKKNGFDLKSEVRAISAHKMAEPVLSAIREYEKKFDFAVVIAVAGKSNALGPLIAGHSRFPVINCPPLSGKFDFMDLVSSIRMPSSVACSTILEPENAALHTVKILSSTDKGLAEKLRGHMAGVRKEITENDKKIKKEFD